MHVARMHLVVLSGVSVSSLQYCLLQVLVLHACVVVLQVELLYITWKKNTCRISDDSGNCYWNIALFYCVDNHQSCYKTRLIRLQVLPLIYWLELVDILYCSWSNIFVSNL